MDSLKVVGLVGRGPSVLNLGKVQRNDDLNSARHLSIVSYRIGMAWHLNIGRWSLRQEVVDV